MMVSSLGRHLLFFSCETILIVLAVASAAYIRLGYEAWYLFEHEQGVVKALLLAGIVQTCSYYADLYDLRIVADRRQLFIRIFRALGAATFLLLAIYFWVPSMVVGRGVFALAATLVLLLVFGWRIAYEWYGRELAPRERLLLVGTSPAAVAVARELYNMRNELGLTIVGFVDPDPAMVGQPMINPGVIGTVGDIPQIVDKYQVDRVVVSLADARGKLPMDELLDMRLTRGVAFSHLASVYEQYTGKIAVENLRPSWLIFSEGFRKDRALLATKRAMDIGLSGFALVVLSPLLLLVAALIKLTSPGPALYHQSRVGRAGRLFTVHKFRSMRADAERTTGAVWAASNDNRVTALGRFMRKTRLDELPQLWNVMVGDMSLVGPRPERPEFVAKLAEEIPHYGLRHSVRPGLTGWAQVRYPYGASVEDSLEKLKYDLFYVKHLTLTFDLLIIASTIKTVILQRGAR